MILGGLHIEMAMLGAMGDWLNGCGWSAVMSSACTEGRAENLQNGPEHPDPSGLIR